MAKKANLNGFLISGRTKTSAKSRQAVPLADGSGAMNKEPPCVGFAVCFVGMKG